MKVCNDDAEIKNALKIIIQVNNIFYNLLHSLTLCSIMKKMDSASS